MVGDPLAGGPCLFFCSVCVYSFICYPAACGPKGHGSGGGLLYMTFSQPQPLRVILGYPDLLLPYLNFEPKQQQKEKEKERERSNP